MVVRDLPLSIFPDINEGVPALDLIASGSHCELINSCVLAPIVADSYVRPVVKSRFIYRMVGCVSITSTIDHGCVFVYNLLQDFSLRPGDCYSG